MLAVQPDRLVEGLVAVWAEQAPTLFLVWQSDLSEYPESYQSSAAFCSTHHSGPGRRDQSACLGRIDADNGKGAEGGAGGGDNGGGWRRQTTGGRRASQRV